MKRWTAAEENERVYRHFGSVLALLQGAGPGAVGLGERGLGVAQRVHRAALLDELGRYRARRRFPKNYRFATPTPSFIDERNGTRCAVAHLLEATGETALAARAAASNNHARVPALADDEAFRAWLWRHGLSVREAAIIQPSYCDVAADCICIFEEAEAVIEATVLDAETVRVEAILTGAGLQAGDVLAYQSPAFGGGAEKGQRWIGGTFDAYEGRVALLFPMLDAWTLDTALCSEIGPEAPVELQRATLVEIVNAADGESQCPAWLALEDPRWSHREGTACERAEPDEGGGCAAIPTRTTPWWAAALVAAAMALVGRTALRASTRT